MKYLVLSAFLLFVSCTKKPEPVPTKPVEPVKVEEEKPVVVKAYAFKWSNEKYDQYLVEALKESKLLESKPADAEDFNYHRSGDALLFWGKLMVELAYWESKYDTTAKYKEDFKDSKGNYIYSRGLFMLSIESGRGYGCPFYTAEDVHDPKKNIFCAVKIMERWVLRDGVITSKSPYRGGGRYWAVLRGNRAYTVESLKAIKAANF